MQGWMPRKSACWLVFLLFPQQIVRADLLHVRLDTGETMVLTARVVAQIPDVLLVETAEGSLHLLPQTAVLQREPHEPPEPFRAEQLQELLLSEFGVERCLTQLEKPYVLVLVRPTVATGQSLPPRSLRVVLNRACKFFRSVQQTFSEFMRQIHVELIPPRYPLGVIIFESDRDYEAYTTSTREGPGLSAASTAAFYDLMSNRLVLRLSECTTFDTPLHEAIHQLAYNRGLFQRLAPIPLWLNEGLATGFEGDGERIRADPRSLSMRYAPVALKHGDFSWNELVGSDQPFQGDVLAGMAYAHAWSLHWWLVTRYRHEYSKLLQDYSRLKPLDELRPEQRILRLEDLTGRSLQQLQEECRRDLMRQLGRKLP
ncbi:MAG: hypothetical protein KatS3mg113_0986 [Planctomycetaceae bacterium]|nr:MAG: hypothetical protein KatS3mg113_0986 [Planctomycetaceae bacterium]